MQYNHNFFDGYKLFDKNGKFTKINFKNIAFDKAYQESQTLKLLFNEKQEPINDYLQTCKNSEGKTLFEIFKQENK